jgi:hypothetical protein
MDDHCRVYPNFFAETINTYDLTGASSVRGMLLVNDLAAAKDGCYRLTNNLIPVYHRNLDFDSCFWGLPTQGRFGLFSNFFEFLHPEIRDKTYRIASSGHGAFSIRRHVWNEIDGYWSGFQKFGCEEVYLDLKLGLMDHTLFMNPKIRHFHQILSPKPYSRSMKEMSLVEHQLCVANIVGGAQWAARVAKQWDNCEWGTASAREEGHFPGGHQAERLLPAALARSDSRRLWLESRRKRTLEQQIELFAKEGVTAFLKPPGSTLSKRAFHGAVDTIAA